MKKWMLALCLAPFLAATAFAADEAVLVKQLKLLNGIPEEQLNEKTDPAFSILRTIYDQDGPDFMTLRTMLGEADIRSHLNPSARVALANVVSQRWDTFSLSGNLYLSGLRSKNADLREHAAKKVVFFIQNAHIPELIDLLKVPGPNVVAYQVLQEVSGEHMEPNTKLWETWWVKRRGHIDIVGHLLNDTRTRIKQFNMHPFDQERFWYAPEGVENVQTPFSDRSHSEQDKVREWNTWAMSEVKRYTDDWATLKPMLDRIVHQPDPRVNRYLETLVAEPALGDYASVVLAWRASPASLSVIQNAWKTNQTAGRALARGSLGDKGALVDLLRTIDKHQDQPMTFKIMDDDTRNLLPTLRTVGIVSSEQAFKLLCHQGFEFETANTPKEKKKAYKEAKAWITTHATQLKLDRRRGYFITSSDK